MLFCRNVKAVSSSLRCIVLITTQKEILFVIIHFEANYLRLLNKSDIRIKIYAYPLFN